MQLSIDELLGSNRGVAKVDCNPRVKKRLIILLRKISKCKGGLKSIHRRVYRIFPWHISLFINIKVEVDQLNAILGNNAEIKR
jgi:hypothetical protein